MQKHLTTLQIDRSTRDRALTCAARLPQENRDRFSTWVLLMHQLVLVGLVEIEKRLQQTDGLLQIDRPVCVAGEPLTVAIDRALLARSAELAKRAAPHPTARGTLRLVTASAVARWALLIGVEQFEVAMAARENQV